MGLGLSFSGGSWWDWCGGPWVVVARWVWGKVWWVCLVGQVGLLGVSCGGSVMWWLLVVLLMVDGGWWLLVVLLMVGGGCVVDGGSMGDGVVDDGSVGGDWKFWVDRWVALFLMVG